MSHYERNRELVISGVVSPLIWVRSIVTLLITLLIATHEPPSVPACLDSVHFSVLSV